ncbi:hypothetical protein ABZ038_02350 [Streptomyces sp. NPDC006349]|uniref:hypothetical protein n=1 Tax=Streptomyces sp. NPDC006349 TaxID=3156757 RepID=UPI0006BA0A71|nr:hypothetical protein ADL35_32705 [Streptomyces sp. NRRL WC-3753]
MVPAVPHALSITFSLTWEITWNLTQSFALSAVARAAVRKSTVVGSLLSYHSGMIADLYPDDTDREFAN